MTIAIDTYDVALVVLGLVVFGAVLVPRVLAERVISFPLVLVAAGLVVFGLPLGLEPTHPMTHPELTEHLTEFAVIIALTALGFKIERPVAWRPWVSTWRLLAVAMPLTIVAGALLGGTLAGFVPAAALLLGAVMAPTDPVLAADVQTGPPVTVRDQEERPEEGGEEGDGTQAEQVDPREAEDEVRFALSSEAALNDGLAFPFTNAAIAVAIFGTDVSRWIGRWLWLDVGLRIAVGILVGYAVGWVLARVLFGWALDEDRPLAVEEVLVLTITLTSYGLAEVANGYGFLAVFVCAATIRHYERTHGLHDTLHDAADQLERLAMAVILILLGGALLDGLLEPLTWQLVVVALLLVFVVRPVAGTVALLGDGTPWFQRAILAFFGIRGLGSFFYLAHALNEESFPQARELWAVVAFTALLSMTVHGLTASPVMRRFDAWRDARS